MEQPGANTHTVCPPWLQPPDAPSATPSDRVTDIDAEALLRILAAKNKGPRRQQRRGEFLRTLSHVHLASEGLAGILGPTLPKIVPQASIVYLYNNQLTDVSSLGRMRGLTMLYLQVCSYQRLCGNTPETLHLNQRHALLQVCSYHSTQHLVRRHAAPPGVLLPQRLCISTSAMLHLWVCSGHRDSASISQPAPCCTTRCVTAETQQLDRLCSSSS